MRPPSGLIHGFTILYSVIDLIFDVPSATGDFLRQMAFFDSIRPCRQDIFLHAAAPCGGHCLLICLVRSATGRDRRRRSWPWMQRRSKSRSGGGQGRTSPTGASCPNMSAGRPWICRRIFSVSLTLTAESSTEMKARQGYSLRKMIWPAGAGKNLRKENSLPSAGSPFWKRNPRIRSRKESTSTFYYLDKPFKTRLSCDKQLGNGKYRESESNIYNKFIDFEWMPYPGNACCNESLFLAKAVSESGMTGEKNRRVLE